MSRIIAYDLCRLVIGPNFATPRGIDRVDLAVARQVFADREGPNLAILPTPLGVRVYPAKDAGVLLDHLQLIWGESADTAADMPLQRLIAHMLSPTADTAAPLTGITGLTRTQGVLRTLAMLREIGVRLGRAAVDTVPSGAVYVNMGQLALAVPPFFNWLEKRADVACAFMIHDTIPLDHPNLVKPASVAHHARMVRTAAAHADGLIFSTEFARTSVSTALARSGHAQIPYLVRSLPVSTSFIEVCDSLPALVDTHYFVVISTIEPRKNFALLIRIWERLVARMGTQAPHLVIVGAPGLDAGRILSPLAASPTLRARVHPICGLSTPALARLVLGCAALLSPSFAEGFGLPLLEGIALGVPTIASNIPSHREIAHSTTTLLPANDQVGWEKAILATDRAVPNRRPEITKAMTDRAYYADLIAFLDQVGPGARGG